MLDNYFSAMFTGRLVPLVSNTTYADSRGDISVSSLSAERVTDGVRVSWQTAVEHNCSAFTLLRCTLAGDVCTANYAALPATQAPCSGNASGAAYSATDATAASDQAYSYDLREYDTASMYHDFGPVTVAALPVPAPTPSPSPAPAQAVAAKPRHGCAETKSDVVFWIMAAFYLRRANKRPNA
jgi:hypothetical protein